jgi:NAD(P)-dependent dehydrogenase (short-subunit alcohol dehydrogenase family)
MNAVHDFKGKVAIVTGASRGIGKAIALGLAAGGADVVLSSRREPDLQAVAEEMAKNGGRGHVHACHAAREDELTKLADATKEKFGRIDLLVNNAGTNPVMSQLVDTSVDVWDKIFALNVRGYFVLTKAVVPQMPDGGAVLNISSGAGLRPMPGLSAYSVSKAAVIHLTKTFAFELAPRKIRVNALAPGLIKTRLAKFIYRESAPW